MGGDIVTVNDAQPTAEAVAVKDGKILAVGVRTEIEKAHKGTTTQVVDLGGKTLLPSFIDAHCHYINSLLVANQAKLYAPPSGPGKDVDSIVAEHQEVRRGAQDPERRADHGLRLRRHRHAGRPASQPRRPRRAFPDNPVRVDHVSMHGAVLNSLALKKYGYSAATVTPPGGVIVRKPGTNEPYGLIMETRLPPGVRTVGADDAGAGDRVRPRRARCSTRRPASPPPMKGRRTWRNCRR